MGSDVDVRHLLRWTAGFVAFPIAGLVGRALAGPVDDVAAAALGGAATGLVLGIGQVLAGGWGRRAWRWVPASAVGAAVGLAAGAAAVGYRTGLADLALMGALTGAALGLAQALVLPVDLRPRWAWALATGPLWALGWTVTALVGVDVAARYTVFGSTGAIVVCVLSGLLLDRLRAPRPVTAPA